jgi:hypothetical protein
MKQIKRAMRFKEMKKRRDETGVTRKEWWKTQGSQNTFDSLAIYSAYLRLCVQFLIGRSAAIKNIKSFVGTGSSCLFKHYPDILLEWPKTESHEKTR